MSPSELFIESQQVTSSISINTDNNLSDIYSDDESSLSDSDFSPRCTSNYKSSSQITTKS